ncbi:hypothetical protein C8A05DRAFT_45067 [Staphylotrichum tortipilum]|uniref:Structure-specific endonuclease subunit SLX4 n=1 Tax=Staphylotrichum tortipilum TaxID=2831512 RepID=A0AAN6MIL1_9PEZI|nr:hypothetical protein C8A05DRAFT_45067 [Staphylotrichum longicolle]
MTEPPQSQDCATEESVLEVPPVTVAPKKTTRKPRTAKETAAAQTTLPKGKVTKAAAKGPQTKKKAGTTSRHFAQQASAPEKVSELRPALADDEPISLEPAMRRRIDWTPPPGSAPPQRLLDSSTMKELSSSAMHAGDDVFRTLRDVYGRNTDDACLDGGATVTSTTTDVLGKRKLIEMVAPAGNKQQTPEKKPRTITDLATAAYQNPRQEQALQSLETTGGESTTASKVPAGKTKTPAKKKEEPRKPVQEFVFGTASQLAIEDDPELLHTDPNLAIRRRPGPGLWAAAARGEEGELLGVPVLDLTGSSPLSLPPIPVKAAAAGQSMAADKTSTEQAFLSKSPPVTHPGHPKTTPNTFGSSKPDLLPPPSNQEQHQLLLLSESSSPSPQRPELPPQPNFELYTDARLAREVASYGFKACWESQHTTGLGAKTTQATMSTTSAQQAAARSPTRGRPRNNATASAKAASRPRGRPRKNSAASTVAEAVEPAATPKRGRKKSPSKRPRGRPRKDAAEPAPAPKRGRKKSPAPSDAERESPPQPSKRPRGRPKKDASPAPPAKRSRATTTPKSPSKPLPTTPGRRKASPGRRTSIIEIPDSDSDPFASTAPSSPSSSIIFSPPASPTGAPDLSITEDTETSLLAGPTTQQVSLFGYITRAVVSAPRSADGEEPSWHEKMLMYDPVILEELTAWLNAGQLDKVGYEGEVGAGDVKRWCESRSFNDVLYASRNLLFYPSLHNSPWQQRGHPRPCPSWGGAEWGGAGRRRLNTAAEPRLSLCPAYHQDGPAYRLAAIRETFEESGILLAKKAGQSGDRGLLHVPDEIREAGRKAIHGNKIKFTEWLTSVGGEPDVDNLIPFTRWITPYGPPKRFTTQMYLYMLPISTAASTTPGAQTALIPTPTHDGGLEHTAATFNSPHAWLAQARNGAIILFPPQFYLLTLVSQFLPRPTTTTPTSPSDPSACQAQRATLLTFLRTPQPPPSSPAAAKAGTHAIAWADKVMSPAALVTRKADGRIVLALDRPGPELKGSGRGGDWERVRGRGEVLEEERGEEAKL